MNDTVKRIRQMELYFDLVKQAVGIDPIYAKTDTHVKSMLDSLTEYYEGGQWQKDYEADERGELPSDLKRGVLSQDGLWNLLDSLK